MPQACHHCFELVIIVFCFICTAGSFMLLNSDVLRKERNEVQQPHRGEWRLAGRWCVGIESPARQSGLWWVRGWAPND